MTAKLRYFTRAEWTLWGASVLRRRGWTDEMMRSLLPKPGYLRAHGIAAETLDFPQYNAFFGRMVRDYLNGKFGATRDLPAEYTMLPYALDRLQHQPQIATWLRDGKWVILDRYTYSNAFSVAKCPREQWDEK